MAQKRIFSRRRFLGETLAGGLATVLVACGQAAPAATSGGEASAGGADATAASASAAAGVATGAAGTIDFLAWGDNADLPGWDALIKGYADVQPDTTVNLTTVADPGNNFYTKLQTAIAGGNPPHIASFQGWEWQTYADNGLLQPLDELISGDSVGAIYDESVAAVQDTTVRNGQRFLVPLQLASMVMFYSKPLFDAAGVAYPTDDWTFDQFVQTATTLTGERDGKKIFGYQPNNGWFRDIHWIRSTGKREFDSLVDPKQATFNQPEIVEIVQRVAQDFVYQQNIAPTPADLQGNANTINTGNAALKYEGPWFFGQLNSPDLRGQGKQVDFDVVLMPEGTDPARPHRGWSEGVALFKTDQAPAAWAFARYAAGEEGQKVYSGATGRIPNTLALAESFWLPEVQERYQVSNAQAFLTALKSSQVDVIGKLPRSKMWSQVVKPIAWDPLINNSAKAADVLPAVDAELQKLLDEANKG